MSAALVSLVHIVAAAQSQCCSGDFVQKVAAFHQFSSEGHMNVYVHHNFCRFDIYFITVQVLVVFDIYILYITMFLLRVAEKFAENLTQPVSHVQAEHTHSICSRFQKRLIDEPINLKFRNRLID